MGFDMIWPDSTEKDIYALLLAQNGAIAASSTIGAGWLPRFFSVFFEIDSK